ncbi:DUF3309 family protein [Oceanisphaera marina]|uniref:DUF3309 family protein n=1 Tax=Oceanisphaera marina TaxID=2017550 RepID=UPI0027E3BA04|nr:DUF3309 family protein [Oceanisphaera marina]
MVPMGMLISTWMSDLPGEMTLGTILLILLILLLIGAIPSWPYRRSGRRRDGQKPVNLVTTT